MGREYSLRTIPQAIQYVSESALKYREVLRKNESRKVSFTGKKREQETGYFYINAWMLGEVSIEMEALLNDQAIAVLFRDCDGTRSTKAGIWKAKLKSMHDGFTRAGFSRGVPMLPKPKSEAWLICAAKNPPYQECSELEELPGNDDSPNSAKKMLDAIFGGHQSAAELCAWLEDNPFDEGHGCAMPSFEEFKNELVRVLAELGIDTHKLDQRLH